jgi:hypothetical protein
MRLPGELARPFLGDVNGRFTTVVGDVVYLPAPPERLDRDRLAAILAHELVHQLDQARFGLGFYLSYALVGPTLRTRRAHWERRAYAVDLLLAREAGGPAAVDRVAEQLVPLFAGPSYGFMWAGREAARRYLAPTVRAVKAGTLDTTFPYDGILAAWRGPPHPEIA